jgi:hypothetical protein
VLTPLAGTGQLAFPSSLPAGGTRAARAAAPPDTGVGTAHQEFSYAPGQTWLVPAALGTYSIEPAAPSTFLRAYVPNLDTLEQELVADRAAQSARTRETPQ